MLAETVRFFAAANLLAYDAAAAVIDARLAATVRRLGTMDRRIAAICLAHGATQVTGNVRDFGPVPGLVILNWRAGGQGDEASEPPADPR